MPNKWSHINWKKEHKKKRKDNRKQKNSLKVKRRDQKKVLENQIKENQQFLNDVCK